VTMNKQFLKASIAVTVLVVAARARFDEAREAVLDDDRGASTVEYVLLVAGAAAIAIAVVVAVRAAAKGAADSIPTNVDTSTDF